MTITIQELKLHKQTLLWNSRPMKSELISRDMVQGKNGTGEQAGGTMCKSCTVNFGPMVKTELETQTETQVQKRVGAKLRKTDLALTSPNYQLRWISTFRRLHSCRRIVFHVLHLRSTFSPVLLSYRSPLFHLLFAAAESLASSLISDQT